MEQMLETIKTQSAALLGEQLGPFGPLILVGVLGVVLILLALPLMLRGKKDPLDRLKDGDRKPEAKKKVDKQAALRTGGKKDKLEKYSNFLEPQDQESYSEVRLKLLQAGYQTQNAVRIYHFAQFALGLGGLLIGVILAIVKSATGEPSLQSVLMTAMLPGVGGYMLPKYWVTKRQQTRQTEIANGFPDALDLMLVCVEAGQSLDQAIVRVAKEIRAGFPALADEFEMVSYEIKAGKDKINVFRDMQERCGVPDVSSFVTVLIQSATFGTSISDALRVFSAEMRDKRVMRAEEKANTLPTKMTLVTMGLTVPPLLVILVGPSVYDIVLLLSNTSF